jgi:UDP-N-acetylmuramyl pentapeptide phosphotransferase/UDP-N-acetylglucosamine-1-phosphate transferase
MVLEYQMLPPDELFYPPLASAILSWFMVLSRDWHGRYTMDLHQGIQKFHTLPTSRIGGVALFAAMLVAFLLAGDATGGLLGLMILASLPAFLAGLIEDVTKKVGVRERLMATMFSGLLACMLTGVHLGHVDVPLVDSLLRHPVPAIMFTSFAVAGVANSINIIDGFNGLAGGVLMICFGMLGLIAWHVGDMHLVNLCILMELSTFGFMLVNFPFGKIFMGDGGAYLMGFMLAMTAVLLPTRNPQVSPWASIVVCGYPIIETIFSMFRRMMAGTGTGNPDAAHLHSLIKVNVIRRFLPKLPQYLRNSLVSPVCWMLALLFAAPAIRFYNSTSILMLVAMASASLYFVVYRIVLRLEKH